MAKLYLHIGHGKTGSSYLQHVLALNSKFLKVANNIIYPQLESKDDVNGLISSGNGGKLLRAISANDPLAPFSENRESDYLFSSEFFYNDLSWLDCDALFDGSMFDSIEFLLFIRDPIEILSSSFQQSVKRGGYFGSFDEYTNNFLFFRKLHTVITRINKLEKAQLSIRNYSRFRSVEIVVSEWLGIGTFPVTPKKSINRSLSLSEIGFQREFNKYFGREGRLISDALCVQLPDIKGHSWIPSSYAWDVFLERERPFIDKINAIIDEDHHLYTVLPGKTDANLDKDRYLGNKQIEVICKAIGKNLKLGSGPVG